VISNVRNELNRSTNSPASVAEDFYLLERVGFQDTGLSHAPRTPHTSHAKCLTASHTRTLTGGLALGWAKCQDTTVIDQITDLDLLEAQSFKLDHDGTIAAKKSGFCIRRMKCAEGGVTLGHIYDLGDCHDDLSLKIKVEKSQANSMTHMRDMGFLSHAVALELCELCGPYRLQNMCLAGADCGGSYQARPGWTKLASQYVGNDAVTGHSDYADGAGGSDQAQAEVLGIDMSGIGPTKHTDGLCGSWATDSPSLSSFFYVLKADKKR